MIKKLLLVITICFVIVKSFGQLSEDFSAAKYDFVLTHPTVTNLERISFLVENDIINIPNLSVLLIHYEKGKYDFVKSKEYIDNYKGDIEFSFQKLSGDLSKDNLYQNNDLSGQIYDIFNASNGIVFFGGDDIPPYTYGENMELKTVVYDTYRHFFELTILYHLLGNFESDNSEIPFLDKKPDYVIWAFCLGMQTMNVATGGTLVQDIPSEIYNINYVEDVLAEETNQIHKNYWKVLYPEKGFPGSKLHQIFVPDTSFLYPLIQNDKMPNVNSYHHQCIEKLGKGLYPIAYSTDLKIIEAVKHKKYPNVLAFQFHPEKKELYDISIKMVHSPYDSVELSFNELLLQNNSYQFHVNIWEVFSKSFINFRSSK